MAAENGREKFSNLEDCSYSSLKRDEETLIPFINQFVFKRFPMICTDKWLGYFNLKN